MFLEIFNGSIAVISLILLQSQVRFIPGGFILILHYLSSLNYTKLDELTLSQKGLALKEGLKTQDKRKFPINPQLQAILQSIKPKSYQESEFVFRGKKGGIIDFGDFCNHAWKGYKNRHGKMIEGIVTRLVIERKVGEYGRPYQCRHTFITLCLESGIDCKDVARWVGNSPEIIYRHYAGNRRDLQVPEL